MKYLYDKEYFMLVKIVEPNFIFENEKGKLTQLVREGWNQINVITSVAGSDRGGHYHKINNEGFYIISGKIQLILVEDDVEEKYTFSSGDMFIISPYQMHYFEFLEDTVLVSMYDKGVELPRNLKDIYVD